MPLVLYDIVGAATNSLIGKRKIIICDAVRWHQVDGIAKRSKQDVGGFENRF